MIDQSGTNFYFILGPSVGYANKAEAVSKTSRYGEVETDIYQVNFEDEYFSQFDFSTVLGVGVEFPLASGQLIVEGRYVRSLSNLIKDNDMGRLTARNVGLGMNIGYMLPLAFKKKDK